MANDVYTQRVPDDEESRCYINESDNKPHYDDHELHREPDEVILKMPLEEPVDESLPFHQCSQQQDLDTAQSSLLTFRSNFAQLLYSALFLVVSVFFNLTVLAIIHERVPGRNPLPDVSFDLLPKQDRALFVCEYIILFMTTSTFVMIFLHRYRWFVLRRLFMVLGSLYFFRAICMAVTQVPVANPNYTCSPQLNLTEHSLWDLSKEIGHRVLQLSIGLGLSVNGKHTYCGDYIYSGHTLILVTCDLFLVHYWLKSRPRWYWKTLKYLLHIIVAIGLGCILVARGHYTVDIVLAFFLSTLTFYIYQALCDYATRGIDKSSNPLRHIWWYYIFSCVESNTIKHQIKIENVFDSPSLGCLKSTFS